MSKELIEENNGLVVKIKVGKNTVKTLQGLLLGFVFFINLGSEYRAF